MTLQDRYTRRLTRSEWRRRAARLGLGLIAIGLMTASVPITNQLRASAAIVAPGAAVTTSSGAEGSQGTDVALPATNSSQTVAFGQLLPTTSDIYSDYQNTTLTVNQTSNLVNQAISVTWKGAPSTLGQTVGEAFNGKFAGDFLQIMQCWSSPTATGPTPQQCEFGANSVRNPPSVVPTPIGTSNIESRFLDSSLAANLPPGAVLAPGGNPSMPFTGVDGTTVPYDEDLTQTINNGTAFQWVNSEFLPGQSNEDDFGLTSAGGTGSEAFTVDTDLQSPALGCGKATEALSNGSSVTPKCWLVIVPRGTPVQEDFDLNPLPSDPLGQAAGVLTTPLTPSAWANHISIPLNFDPVSGACAGNDAVRIVGNEMTSPGASSWDPKLCAQSGALPYNYTALPDDQARLQLTQGTVGTTTAPSMAVVSEPLNPDSVASNTPLTYAPLSLSGVVVGFNIERSEGSSLSSDAAENALVGVGVQHIYLTPRLVAKMLTESYGSAFPPDGGIPRSTVTPAYAWVEHNPEDLLVDPDFKAYNPEFALNVLSDEADALINTIVEEPSSDAAQEVWDWILADPSAKAWLSGAPDPWGMTVNPYYELKASLNPTGAAFGDPVPNSYPAADPYVFQDPSIVGPSGTITPPPLRVLDGSPYAGTMGAAALETRNGTNAAKTTRNPAELAADEPSLYWSGNPVQPPGQRIVLSITDAASAAQYGLQTASLSVAGDDGPTPTFIAPDATSLEAGEANMVPSSVSGVLTPDVSAPGAYPLTLLSYGAVLPTTLSATSRKAVAAFVDYVATTGQTPGTVYGTLPPGYAPLPPTLQRQSVAAAHVIVTETAPTTASTTSSSTSTSTTTSATTSTTTSPSTTVALTPGTSSTPPPTEPEVITPAETTTTTAIVPTTARPPAPTSTSTSSSPTTAAKTPTPVALATSKTPGVGAGAIRFVGPIVLAVGLMAGLGARWLSLWRRRTKGVSK